MKHKFFIVYGAHRSLIIHSRPLIVSILSQFSHCTPYPIKDPF